MKERLIAHHHAEIVGNNGDTTVKLYSTDDLGNVWGEEFDSIDKTNRVLERRLKGLSILSTSLLATSCALPIVLELGVVKKNKLTKAIGGLAVAGVEGILLGWRRGINDMAFETEGRMAAFQKAAKNQA